MLRSLASFATLLALTPLALAIGTPTGYGAGTTGGGSAAAATPTSTAQLLSWLEDSTARTIVIDKVFDYTKYFGTTTGAICKPWTCSNGKTPQLAINANNWCGSHPSAGTATWNTAGASKSLQVGSNKTLLGKGSNAGLKGIGLSIVNAKNVIVQNIQIMDLNPQYVWGGDAISIINSSKVWIDHNYITRIGRQFIVTHFEPSTEVTISNNVFDGRTSWSASCNNMHYWSFLFTGKSDTITFANNHVYQTSGRGPHTGGTQGNSQKVHLVNNYFDTVDGHALDSGVGTVLLAEGNYFNAVKTPDQVGGGGDEYFIQSVADAKLCQDTFGRNCQWNRFGGSSGKVVSRVVTSVLNTFKSVTAVTSYRPIDPDTLSSYIQQNAGVGKIN